MLPGRAPGLHLAEAGNTQAAAAAARLTELKKVDAVYSSPLERTRETAAPIGKSLGLRVARERGLLECDFGDWTGRKLKDLMKLPEWRTVQRYPSGFRFPNGESFTEMQNRITGTLAELAMKHRGGVVVAVSHADPIKAAIAHYTGVHLDLFQRIVVSPASVTAFAFSPHGVALLKCNDTGGLDELVPPKPDKTTEPTTETTTDA